MAGIVFRSARDVHFWGRQARGELPRAAATHVTPSSPSARGAKIAARRASAADIGGAAGGERHRSRSPRCRRVAAHCASVVSACVRASLGATHEPVSSSSTNGLRRASSTSVRSRRGRRAGAAPSAARTHSAARPEPVCGWRRTPARSLRLTTCPGPTSWPDVQIVRSDTSAARAPRARDVRSPWNARHGRTPALPRRWLRRPAP